MKKHILFIFIFCLPFVTVAQNKYAVLITGDYAAKGVPEQYRWNKGGDKDHRPPEEFWHDTFLMWKMLQTKGFDRDNIFVLFADGVDYESDNPLYIPPIGDTVTNDSATISNVTNLFTDLRNGFHGRPRLTEDDFLFVWVFDHGKKENDHSFIFLLDGMMSDTELSSLLNVIPTNRKVYWMQQCNGGGFADELQAGNVVFHSACQAGESAYPADDYTINGACFVENDTLNSYTYYHGEFDYHLLSVCNGHTPTGQLIYAGDTLSDGDLNHDRFVSFHEAYIWEKNHESIEKYSPEQLLLGETPLYSDMGNIGQHASFDYPTLLFDSISGSEIHRGIIGISKDLYVADGQTLTITGNSVVTLCNNAKLVIEEGGGLVINGNVSFYGTNDNVLEIHGNFTNNSNDTIYFNNIQVEVTSESFTIGKAAFNDTELKYEPLSSSAISVLPSSGSITIRNCRFTNNNKQVAIRVKNSLGYYIDNNKITSSLGNGIYIMNSGNTANAGNTIREVSNNTIYGCVGTGLVFYASSGDVMLNKVYYNTIGVKLLNNCNIRNFTGRCSATTGEHTQYIHDNDSYEIYLTSNCSPHRMQYNLITDGGDTPYMYYDGNVDFGDPNLPIRSIIDVASNSWGYGFNPITHLYSTSSIVIYNYLPYWSMGTCFDDWTDAEQLIATADSLCELGEYATANNAYRQVVNRHPHTPSAATALKSLLSLEKEMGQDFTALQQYYLTDSAIMSDTILCKLASALSNKCDEIMGNYADAIAWYEGAITNPNTTYCDSVFATIDLDNLYLELEENGVKSVGKMTQLKPDTRATFDAQCQYVLSLLPKQLGEAVPHITQREGPLPLWTDTITSQPEGYTVDAEGCVEISSYEGLVWLISVVNGLNGCEPDDFDGRTVKLTDDIDFGETGLQYNFSPIGTRDTPFCGTFDGNCHKIQHLRQRYSRFEPPYHHYFDIGVFGYIHHAEVKNATLDPTCQIFSTANDDGYFRGEMVGFADSLSIVENCHFNNTGVHTFGGGLVGLNRNSTVRNCSCGGHNNGLGSPEEGAGVVATNRSEGGYADAIVENCYFCGSLDPSFSTWYVGGLVCYNETAVNNNGYKAIIRNCHSTPTSDFWSYKEYGSFAAISSEGSSISNCYTDFTKVSFPLMVGLNQGELNDCSSYTIIDEVATFSAPVNVYGNTTEYLLDALNLWIVEQENPGVYRSWTMDSNNIPVFDEYYIGIPEIKTSEEVILYPNPTTSQFTVEGANVARVEVYNLVGQKVHEADGQVVHFDAAEWHKGIYLVNIIEQNGAVVTKKLVVK